MLPNLIIIGAAKSGTTALHYYLGLHPEVHMSEEKETNFFLPPDAWPLPEHRPARTLAEYERFFAADRPVRGESSVSYSFHPYPAGVPDAIHAVVPGARIIYAVRDPVQRSISHHHQRVAIGMEHRTLAEVVADPDDARERYIAASSYATQLEQYLRLFPAERILVLDQAALLADRRAELARAFGFLGVDPGFDSARFDALVHRGQENRTFTPAGDRLRRSWPYRKVLMAVRPDVRRRLVAPLRTALSSAPPREAPPDAVREHLAEVLAPEAERFRALTGMAFADWSV